MPTGGKPENTEGKSCLMYVCACFPLKSAITHSYCNLLLMTALEDSVPAPLHHSYEGSHKIEIQGCVHVCVCVCESNGQ